MYKKLYLVKGVYRLREDVLIKERERLVGELSNLEGEERASVIARIYVIDEDLAERK